MPRGDIRRFVWTEEDLEPGPEGPVRSGGSVQPDPEWTQDLRVLRLLWDLSRRLRRGRGRPRAEGRERVLRVVMTEEEWKRLDDLQAVVYRLTHRRVSEGTLLGLIGAAWLKAGSSGKEKTRDSG